MSKENNIDKACKCNRCEELLKQVDEMEKFIFNHISNAFDELPSHIIDTFREKFRKEFNHLNEAEEKAKKGANPYLM